MYARPQPNRRGLIAARSVLLVFMLTCVLAAASGTARADGPAIAALGPFGLAPDGTGQPAGRTQDIAVDPADANHLLALSDSALWESRDGGGNWHRLRGLDRYGQYRFEHGSMLFVPGARGVALIASPTDDRVATGRGIYRSTDSGQTWAPARRRFQPTCAGGGAPSVLTRRGGLLAVGAGCQVGTSTDAGASWTWSMPDPGGEFFGVGYDVANNLFACGRNGLFKRGANSATWSRILLFTSRAWTVGTPIWCRLTASRDDDNHVFISARWRDYYPYGQAAGRFSAVFEVYRNTDGVWRVRNLRGGGHNNGRDVLLQTRPIPGGYQLFWHSTDLTYFDPCRRNPDHAECPVGTTGLEHPAANPPWVVLGHNAPGGELHADDTRIVFEPTSPFCLRFISSDGGIQKPNPGNCDGTGSWSYTDAGIHATESFNFAMTELTNLPPPPVPDLYIATQDNGGYVRLSRGSWVQRSDSDGQAVVATPTVSAGALATVRTYWQNNTSGEQIGTRGLDNLRPNTAAPFQPPYDGLQAEMQAHQLVIAGGRYVLAVSPTGISRADLFTSSVGETWTRVTGRAGTLVGFVNGRGGVAIENARGSLDRLFVRAQGRLWRIDDVAGFARAPIQVARPWIVGPYAVGDSAHVIAFVCDAANPVRCTNGQIVASGDGGMTWRSLPVVMRMATTDAWGNVHRLVLDSNGGAMGQQVAGVAVAPLEPRLMVVITQDAGLLASGDGGTSWQRMSPAPALANDLRLDSAGVPYISTFGRGMFSFPGMSPRTMSVRFVTSITGGFNWRAVVQTMQGTPVAGVTVDFSVTTDGTTETFVGRAVTDALGRATLPEQPPGAPYTLRAKAHGMGISELQAEARSP